MSSVYEQLVATASESEVDWRVDKIRSAAWKRVYEWAEVIAEEIDEHFSHVWRLEQADIELIYGVVRHRWFVDECQLFKPNRVYAYESLFVRSCVSNILQVLATSTPERREIRREREKELETNPPQQPLHGQKLVLAVAGKQIMIDSAESALAVYTDCSFRGKNITIMYPGVQSTLQAQVMQRSVGDTTVCIAIFNRLLMRGAFDNVPFKDERCKCHIFTGKHYPEEISLYCGNLAEVEFIGRHGYAKGFIPEDEE